MPKLIKEFEIHPDVKIDEIAVVGPGPFGQRLISNVTGGQIVGNRLKGTIISPGGDWALVGEDGFARIDVRLTFKTVDGALIYVQFFGVAQLTPAIMSIAGGDTPANFGEQYIFVNPRLETGDPRYSWVNQTVFIGEGRLLPGPRIEFHVYRVANS
jgi:Protein of unknown function (DUF3237)